MYWKVRLRKKLLDTAGTAELMRDLAGNLNTNVDRLVPSREDIEKKQQQQQMMQQQMMMSSSNSKPKKRLTYKKMEANKVGGKVTL